MGYSTLFEVSGIHHLNTGLQITHDIYINGAFLLLFDLTPDRGASEYHSPTLRTAVSGFNKPLPEAITCLLYLEFDNSVLIGVARIITTDV